jgi:NAD(P)H dehydrogenase (quinone)
MLVSIATSVRHGFLGNTTTDLAELLGRPLADPLIVAADTASAMRPASW